MNLRSKQSILLGLLGIGVIWMFSPWILSIGFGAVLALALAPMTGLKGIRRLKPWMQATVITIVFCLAIWGPVLTLLFFGIKRILPRIQDFPELVKTWGTESYGLEWLAGQLGLPPDELIKDLQEPLHQIALYSAQKLGSFLAAAPGVSIEIILSTFLLWVFLMERNSIKRFIRVSTPFQKEWTAGLSRALASSCRSVVLAACVSGLAQAALFGIGMGIARVSYAVIGAFVVFIFSFVPVIGALPVLALSIIIPALQSDWRTAIALGVTSLIVSFSDNLLRPWVLSRAVVTIHPILGFLCVLGAVEAFGFIGLFIGPVIMTGFLYVLRSISQEDVSLTK